jgi:beta-galactosidase
MNGANVSDGQYQPDVSSYDYDAPIDEAGRLRPKYYALRKMIADVTKQTPMPVPVDPPMMTLPEVRLTASRSLWNGLSQGVIADAPLSMEDVGQAYGYVLYRARVVTGGERLSFEAVHSYARVYVDGELVGVVDRRLKQTALKASVRAGQRLDVLVENTGRVNFTTQLRSERAGILGEVKLDGSVLRGWKTMPLPLSEAPADGYAATECSGPCFYRGDFHLDVVGDTYLNTARLGKGVMWVNGHLLGRFWNVGPMGSLFLPGAWLHQGTNEMIVFDLDGAAVEAVHGDAEPTYLKPVAVSAVAR